RLEGLEKCEALVDPLADLGERLLGVRVRRRLLAAEICGRVLGLIAGRLYLADERVLVRRQARLRQHIDVEGLGLRVRGGLVHPLLDVLQRLGEQANGIVVIHAILLCAASVSAPNFVRAYEWDSPRRVTNRPRVAAVSLAPFQARVAAAS